MRLSTTPIDPAREVVYQAELVIIAAQAAPWRMRALGKRLASYRSNRIAAEHGRGGAS